MVSKPAKDERRWSRKSAYLLHNMTGGATARVDLHGP